MPLYWILKRIKRYHENPLQANSNKIPPTNVKAKSLIRASICTSKIQKFGNGSLTVEAAVILPLFFLGVVSLICLLEVFRMQAEVTVSLNQSAKELGMYAFAVQEDQKESPVGVVTEAVCKTYASTKLKQDKHADIRLVKAVYKDNVLELKAAGKYRFPVVLVPLRILNFQNKVRVHDWTGYHSDEGNNSDTNDRFVYVSERQTVYHTSSSCTHLNLSIIQISADTVGKQRNENGAKYHPCKNCIAAEKGKGTFYITKEGDRYHSTVQCSSIKRVVKLVPKSAVGSLQECTRCQGKGGGK